MRARACLALGRYDEAAGLARSALAAGEVRSVPWLTHEGHHILSRVAAAQGDHWGALEECERAIASIERAQSNLTVELCSNFLDDKVHVYQDAIDGALHLGDTKRAFAYLERAKSRALVDYLASNAEVRLRTHRGTNQELVEELSRLREEHNWFYNRLYGYGLAQPAEREPKEAELRMLQEAVRDREKWIKRLLERLALQDADNIEGIAVPEAGRLAPPALGAGSVLLEYYFRDDGGAAFVVSEHGLEVVPLTARPSAIQRLLYQWQLNLDATARAVSHGQPVDGLGRNARGILQALYRALVQPIETHIAGRERIVVVPYGPAHWVPWHALHDGQHYLVESHEVSTCPSSSLLRLCAGRSRRVGRSALVVACSDGGRLPYVVREAEAVAALLGGERHVEAQATRSTLVEGAARHGVFHLAAHAEARLDNPTFAHLKLADGQLSTVDVFNLQLDGALVTLSACETGRSVVTGGDELIGLSRGFLYAGAATLVQSLWRVEDGSTARLMSSFYHGLRAG
ncbi:MAG: CHAT domain-containing protein, partial [Chloroflexota bacterium]